MIRRLAVPGLLAAVCVAAAACGSSPSGSSPSGSTSSPAATGGLEPTAKVATTSVTLDGAGANSIEPFFEQVFYQYGKKDPSVTVNYSPAGSSVGVKDVEQDTVAFGDSEIPMTSTQLAAATGGTVLQVPVDLGGVAISYDVPGAPRSLKLDGPTLAGIFDGQITNWDAPQIARVTGDRTLPDLPIVPVHRSDSSGPGWDLDQYLIDTAPSWVQAIGTSTPSTTWPLASVGVGEDLNTGVSTYIQQTSGAIGFVSYGYALQSGFADAALENKAGDFVAPSGTSIAAAGSQAKDLSSTDFDIVDEPGAGTYPLANFSWTLVYQKQADAATGVALGELLDYVVTTGQDSATELGYSPLPANVQKLAIGTLEKLQGPTGTPLFRS